MGKNPELIAAVDMGSSSFRMIVARVEYTLDQPQIYIMDSLREPVKLGAGLDENKQLDEASMQRGEATLARFGERLRAFHPDKVAAVATNAVRVARNGPAFIARAEKALGFDIDTISGAEEARLVYVGAAHQLPLGRGRRLVVDIGGGSTEFIIGEDYEPLATESLYVGCVSSSKAFFPEGKVTAKAMRQAILMARQEVTVLRRQLTQMGWQEVIGSSGTARALSDLCIASGATTHGLNLEGLQKLRKNLEEAGHIDKADLNAIKEDRRINIPGGLAVMLAVFEELDLTDMEVTDGALRQGLLYDLIGRTSAHDMREVTVAQFSKRYATDLPHAERVKTLACSLYEQALGAANTTPDDNLQLLGWAAQLHEIGLTISHNGYHKHSAYILGKADMPGFSKREQAKLADWVLAHTGKLGKVDYLFDTPSHWLPPMCLRLAALILRRRSVDNLPTLKAKLKGNTLQLKLDKQWLDEHPLTRFLLESEITQWKKIGPDLDIPGLSAD